MNRAFGLLAALLLGVGVLAGPGAGQEQQMPPCVEDGGGKCDVAVSNVVATADDDVVVVTASVANVGANDAENVEVSASAPDDWSAPKPVVFASLPLKALPQTVRFEFSIPDSARDESATFTVRATEFEDEIETDNNSASDEVEIPPATPTTTETTTKTTTATEPELPDLQLRADAALGVDRSTMIVTAIVQNIGSAKAARAEVHADAAGWGEQIEFVRALAPKGDGDDVQLTFPIPDDRRGKSVSFEVEVEPVPREESFGNNSAKTLEVSVPLVQRPERKPDLTVDASAHLAGDQVLVSALVANAGNARSKATLLVVEAPGWGEKARPVPALLAGDGVPRTFTFAIPERERGRAVRFRALVQPVADEEATKNNEKRTEGLDIPPAEPPPDDGVSPWLIVGVVAAALGLLVLAGALAWRARPRRPRATYRGGDAGPLATFERPVRTGFAPYGQPDTPVPEDVPLAPGEPYYFWLEVGPPAVATPPGRSQLTVALFPLDGNLSIPPGADTAELVVGAEGPGRILRQPGDAPVPRSALADRRLFFPVRVGTAGQARLRCSLYHDHVLVQTRLVASPVDGQPPHGGRAAARSTVRDYTLAPQLAPTHLQRLGTHRLSIFINEARDGTHDFYFLGEQEFKSQSSVPASALQDLVEMARGALRQAAWGDRDPWAEGKRYRYGDPDAEPLAPDLARLALNGYRFYDAVINRIAGGPNEARELAALMRSPGLVQVASKEAPTQLLPAALLYDHPLDTTLQLDGYRPCPSFLAALDSAGPLEETECFLGRCPSRGDLETVCPSGFWGYRHALGMPVSVGEAPDTPAEIAYRRGPSLVVAVSTDPAFVLRVAHEQALRGLLDGLIWSYAATRADALNLLKATKAEIVYFYCHGGLSNGVPYIQVGPLEERGITRDLIRASEIEWDDPRPLVFINGCHTTALEPEQAIDFVSGLVENAHAAGVIGTEITVFEPLASAFAEGCLRRFLEGKPIGEAVRNARLALLKAGNPLGLAYIPFALASLRLHERRDVVDAATAVTVGGAHSASATAAEAAGS